MPYLPILMIAVFAAFFYRAAEFENESRLLWCGLSIVISLTTMFYLGWGWLGVVLGQAGLFIGITVFRMVRKP
jgi:biotin transporter BioY